MVSITRFVCSRLTSDCNEAADVSIPPTAPSDHFARALYVQDGLVIGGPFPIWGANCLAGPAEKHANSIDSACLNVLAGERMFVHAKRRTYPRPLIGG